MQPCESYLISLSGEIVGSHLRSGNTAIELLKATIVNREYRELPAVGEVDVEINLAILSMVCRECAGANLGHVAVE